MKVIYCDLCGSPIKEVKWILLCTKYTVDSEDSYNNNVFQHKDNQEICDNCKHLIDQIFKYRMEGILKIAKDLKHIYELPTKESKSNKKNKKHLT